MNSDEKLTDVLVDFARMLGTDFSVHEMLDTLVTRVVEVVAVTGAGVMLMSDYGGLHFVAASNDVVLRIEGLQSELGEGPCLEAWRTGEAVAVKDLSKDSRFSRFSPRAWQQGLAAVFTFPLRLDDHRLGALDLYRDTPGPLSPREKRAGQVLADVAAGYLFNARLRHDAKVSGGSLESGRLYDQLTGLPSRHLFTEILDHAVHRTQRSDRIVAVLYIDLDDIDAVSDQFGAAGSDQLLSLIPLRLREALRSGDLMAHFSGAEFGVICEGLRGVEDAQAVAHRLATVLADPFYLNDGQVQLTAHVGLAFAGATAAEPETLLRDAVWAMQEAQQADGGERVRAIGPAGLPSAGHDGRPPRGARRVLQIESDPVLPPRRRARAGSART